MRNQQVFRTLSYAITGILLIYFCSIGVKNFFRYNMFEKDYKHRLAVLNAEIERNNRLKHQLVALEDPDFLEYQIREKLGYIREGETVYKIIWKN